MTCIRSLRLLAIVLAMGILFTATTEGSAKWWDKFGKPEYGGKLVIVTNRLGETFDPYTVVGCHFYPFEQLFMGDLTLDDLKWLTEQIEDILGL